MTEIWAIPYFLGGSCWYLNSRFIVHYIILNSFPEAAWSIFDYVSFDKQITAWILPKTTYPVYGVSKDKQMVTNESRE